MILWRAIQGFRGAGIIPTVFASAYLVFPPARIAISSSVRSSAWSRPLAADRPVPTVGGIITRLDVFATGCFRHHGGAGIGTTIAWWLLVRFRRAAFRDA